MEPIHSEWRKKLGRKDQMRNTFGSLQGAGRALQTKGAIHQETAGFGCCF